MSFNRRHAALAAVAAFALFAGAAGGAVATQTISWKAAKQQRVIRACQNLYNGLLRIPRPGGRCWVGERQLTWNVRGRTGLQGAIGAKGARGARGPAGIPGAAGTDGPAGARGLDGSNGATGPAGAAGADGEAGPQGPQGLQGLQGDQGLQGLQGDPGPQGLQGDAGPQGDKGDAGAPGLQGPKGDAGAQGAKGDTGAQGPKGDTGAQGPKGDTGPQGPPDPSATAFLSRIGMETGGAAASSGRECTLGEIMLTAAYVATSGLPVAGQLLTISDNTALFSLLGTTYGGDGKDNFRLPDLRSVTPNGLTYSICVDGIYPSRL
jgi:Phage Tail Collar Domain/Collagen triple helix repeat (20 copies)